MRPDFERRWSIGSFTALVRPPCRGIAELRRRRATTKRRRRPRPRRRRQRPASPPRAARPCRTVPWRRRPRRPGTAFRAAPWPATSCTTSWSGWPARALRSTTRPPAASSCSAAASSRAGATAPASVQAWLAAVVTTELPPVGAALAAIRRPLPEMEFWFPSDGLAAGELDALCRAHLLDGRDRPPLPERELRGMLMGFADLVFEHGGRWWVLDYKSNALGPRDADYTPPRCSAAMAGHRYDVQAALYLLALHRLLRLRLGPAYDPARQLGGAVYFFIRGIRGPASGCHHLPAPLALLDALDALLRGAGGRVHDRARTHWPCCRAGPSAGWMRRLDAAFARFLLELCPAAPAPVVLAAALAAHLEGRGHSCLPLDELLHDAEALLGWPPAARDAWSALMAGLPTASARLGRRPAGQPAGAERRCRGCRGPAAAGAERRRLYLRRYWRCERRVAAQVVQRVAAAPQAVDENAARVWLDRLFPPLPSRRPRTGRSWPAAWPCAAGLTLVTGGPGTGKTYTAARLLALLYALDAAPAAPARGAGRAHRQGGGAAQAARSTPRWRTCSVRSPVRLPLPRPGRAARPGAHAARAARRATRHAALAPRRRAPAGAGPADRRRGVDGAPGDDGGAAAGAAAAGASGAAGRQGPARLGGGRRGAGRPVPRRRCGALPARHRRLCPGRHRPAAARRLPRRRPAAGAADGDAAHEPALRRPHRRTGGGRQPRRRLCCRGLAARRRRPGAALAGGAGSGRPGAAGPGRPRRCRRRLRQLPCR